MGDANQTLVWVIHITTRRGIHRWKTTTIGHSHNGQNSRRAANVERGGGGGGGRPAVNNILEETGVHRDNPRSVPCSRPTDRIVQRLVVTFRRATQIEYSERLTPAKWQDEGGTERLCSPDMELEMAIIHLQRDVDECRTELELARKHIPAVTLRPQRWSGFTSTPVPRYSGKSNWEQYREVFEAIVCLNGWDDVMLALQLLSHLDGDALNVALQVPESRRVVPGFLIKSLSDHYNAPGCLAEYKRQFHRAFRRPEDDPSMFAIELETLARRAFMDIDTKIQLHLVRDRFIDGHAECALRRHLDSLGQNTHMTDIIDCCRVWESHREVEIQPQTSADRRPIRVICQVTEVEPASATSPETETVEDIIRKLLRTLALPPPQVVPIPSDRDLLIQQLMATICPPTPVAQE